MRTRVWLTVLALALIVLTAGAALRGAEYDEGYTLLLTAGHRLPDWPDTPLTARTARAQLEGAWSLGGIAAELRSGDVHPPLYFWTAAAWRSVAGGKLFALRLLSVLFGVAAVALVGWLARSSGAPAGAAMLMTLGCYGFAYTSMVARGFALAQVLTLAGVAVLLAGRRDLPAGLLLGAATFANYLAGFAGGAAVLWAMWRGRWAAAAGLALWMPADVWFFLAQRGSRDGQFPPFALGASLVRLARYGVASIFGGLPLYAGTWSGVVAAAVSALAVVVLMGLATRFRSHPANVLFALCAAAPPAGLLALGAVFGNTPIELRYLAFSAPFVALLMAGGLPGWARGCVVTVQAAAIAGLLIRPETMQPQARAAREASKAGGLALVPRGNDGVGIPVAFALEADAAQRLLVVPPETDAMLLRVGIAGEARVVLVLLGQDADSRATLPVLRAAMDDACWKPVDTGAVTMTFDHAC